MWDKYKNKFKSISICFRNRLWQSDSGFILQYLLHHHTGLGFPLSLLLFQLWASLGELQKQLEHRFVRQLYQHTKQPTKGGHAQRTLNRTRLWNDRDCISSVIRERESQTASKSEFHHRFLRCSLCETDLKHTSNTRSQTLNVWGMTHQ